jgi:ABC-type bacteriocin/lantibiotic exporter with double-glycine peptidase domain
VFHFCHHIVNIFLGQFIEHIYTYFSKLRLINVFVTSIYFFASWRYTLSYICPVVIFVLLLVLYRKNLKENANVSLVRTKKANKAAVKRLKVAARLMKQGKSHEFYEEVLKAMWGYFSDKLTIPVSELTKDNVVGELSARGVDEQQIKELKLLLDECEFARYAPGDTGTTMNDIYRLSIRVISDIENTIK